MVLVPMSESESAIHCPRADVRVGHSLSSWSLSATIRGAVPFGGVQGDGVDGPARGRRPGVDQAPAGVEIDGDSQPQALQGTARGFGSRRRETPAPRAGPDGEGVRRCVAVVTSCSGRAAPARPPSSPAAEGPTSARRAPGPQRRQRYGAKIR